MPIILYHVIMLVINVCNNVLMKEKNEYMQILLLGAIINAYINQEAHVLKCQASFKLFSYFCVI